MHAHARVHVHVHVSHTRVDTSIHELCARLTFHACVFSFLHGDRPGEWATFLLHFLELIVICHRVFCWPLPIRLYAPDTGDCTGVTLHAVADTLAADLVATHTVTDTSHVSDSTRVSYTIHKLKVVD